MRRVLSFIASLSVAIALLWTFTFAQASGEPLQPVPSDTASAPLLTRADLEAWLDGLLPYEIERGDIAGAVVAVVKDGEVLLQKGYGYADVARRTPVDPERTLFRAGSVSKLFTWTAVMQLVEQGKLDLDRDINTYLDFAVPPAFGQPITLRHLMTHTPGFEEPVKGLIQSDPQRFESLEGFVKQRVPRRIFPPGEVPAYSNYGVALAGYIVQRTARAEFNDYLEQHIFQPLGMRHSTFRQPLPDELAADMSKGYQVASGPAFYFELVGASPAGALSITGADMARFMIAHLQARDYEGGVLRPQTARLMHESTFKAVPPANGMSLGFFDRSRNGRRIIEHGGDTHVFHSDLELLIDDGVGMFVSFNSSGREDAADGIRWAIHQRFVDRYFPAPPAVAEPAVTTAVEHGDFLARAGRYQLSRRAESSFLSLTSLLSQDEIRVHEDGTLSIPALTGVNGEPTLWREVGPYLWRAVNGKERLVARIENGSVQALGVEPSAGWELMQPVPTAKSAAWNTPLFVGASIVILLTVVFWPVAVLARYRQGTRLPLVAREALAYRWVRVAAAIDLLFLLGWISLILAGDGDLSVYDGRLDAWIRLVQVFGLSAVVGSLIAVLNAWLTCRGASNLWAKVWSVALAISAVAVVWFALAFHMLTINLDY